MRIKVYENSADLIDVYVFATTSSSQTWEFGANSYVFAAGTDFTQTEFSNWYAVGTKEDDEISDVVVPVQSSTSGGKTLKWCQFYIQKSSLDPTVFPNLFAE